MTQETIIKGRIAEAIVRCMFEDLGFEVIPYGYEHTCPTIARRGNLIRGDVQNHIRKAPDFIIVNKDAEANFVEVKFRADGKYKKEMDYPYQDCYFILLSRKYIGIEQWKNLKEEECELKGDNFTSLQGCKNNFKGFTNIPLFYNMDEKSKEIVLEYRKLLIKYMGK
jgi:hypothetical protein